MEYQFMVLPNHNHHTDFRPCPDELIPVMCLLVFMMMQEGVGRCSNQQKDSTKAAAAGWQDGAAPVAAPVAAPAAAAAAAPAAAAGGSGRREAGSRMRKSRTGRSSIGRRGLEEEYTMEQRQ